MTAETQSEQYRLMLLRETLERIRAYHATVVEAVKATGGHPAACCDVEDALEWLLREPRS